MLFPRKLIALLALASAAFVVAAPTPAPLASEEITPTPDIGEIFEYGSEYKREEKNSREVVTPTPEIGEIFEYGSEYKREEKDAREAVTPTPEIGEIFEYGSEYKREERTIS